MLQGNYTSGAMITLAIDMGFFPVVIDVGYTWRVGQGEAKEKGVASACNSL
jgi:hypothetical protein